MKKGVCMLMLALSFFSIPVVAAITSAQLNLFKQHHFLVLVYSSHCRYCERFIPVVKDFEIKHQWFGVAFTVDTASPLWPDVEPLTHRLKSAWFGQQVQVPALLLYSDSGTLSFVSFGYLNQDALEKRLSILIATLIKHEASGA